MSGGARSQNPVPAAAAGAIATAFVSGVAGAIDVSYCEAVALTGAGSYASAAGAVLLCLLLPSTPPA